MTLFWDGKCWHNSIENDYCSSKTGLLPLLLISTLTFNPHPRIIIKPSPIPADRTNPRWFTTNPSLLPQWSFSMLLWWYFLPKKIYFVWMEPSVLWCCWLGGRKGIWHEKQESLANAKLNARQHCVSLSCLCNSLTQIEWVVQLFLPPKHAKSREIPREFDLTAVQGHPRSSILVSMESPYMTSY